MLRISLLVAVVCTAVTGCAPGPAPTAGHPVNKPLSRVEKMSGSWTGKYPEKEGQVREGAESGYLAEQLGGYTLDLRADGTYASNWRGLTKEGSWSIEGDAIVLRTNKVLGKTLDEAKAENGKAAKPVNDLSLFSVDNRLQIGPDDSRLDLPGKDKASLPLTFSRG